MSQKLRVEYEEIEPESPKSIYAMTRYVKSSGIEENLRDLIYVRVSQINGCAYCMDMHTQDAIAHGIPPQKIGALSAWRDAPFFTKREMLAIEFAEALTKLPVSYFPDELYHRVREEFDEHKYVALIMTVNIINCWNRMMIACGGKAGMYDNQDLKKGSPGYFAKSD